MPHSSVRTERNGLSIRAYRGDGMVLLAFNLDASKTTDLAGFAVKRTPPPSANSPYLPNRIDFTRAHTAETTPSERRWTPSIKAPFQKFRWTDFPSEPGIFNYEVTAMYYRAAGGLREGDKVDVTLDITPEDFGELEAGFTRGYISSQAYRNRFNNEPISPPGRSLLFDTGPYQLKYDWLGYHARKMLFAFLRDCLDDPAVTVDLFAYDLDEPDFIRELTSLGPRLRAILDDSASHTGSGDPEVAAKATLVASAGAANVKSGKFKRYAHNKVLIQKVNGVPKKVLTGSANFSLRGLYVQANNILVFDNPTVAAKYEDAFQQAWANMTGFASSQIASRWFTFNSPEVPDCSVSFAPHKAASVSLDVVAKAIRDARSSVLFAVMELGGGGDVMDELKKLGRRRDLFSWGVTQSARGIRLVSRSGAPSHVVSFSYLRSKVPRPFRSEWSGGAGKAIHHKFVVVDFNGSDPVVFTGSSNLALGGEQENGDNLIAIRDPQIATIFAIEAVRLLDHYRFREVQSQSQGTNPVRLASRSEGLWWDPGSPKKWWELYYDPIRWKYRDRLLFA